MKKKEKKKLYHITSLDNLKPILENGINSNSDGEIFLFDQLKICNQYVGEIFVSDHIAMSQIGIEEYVLLEINPNGVFNEMETDNVSEFTAPAQWILKQKVIDQKYLKVFGFRRITLNRYSRFSYKWHKIR